MTDTDIHFGEVQQLPPQHRRRPDRDRHFAVVDYGTPSHDDLPIFVDADVLADMETHSRTDTSVELGGVLLGGQYVDDDGNPFVVVSDSLRAQHYESSRGHFKFTHDTWTQIGHQRDEFSDDLQMVGWYHTHPDWGVFLSGMDRFICDHFFDRPLDVALVIDPLRNDRGWFYWKQDGGERLPRTGGFRVTASRFRRRELAAYVAQLESKITMKPDSTFGGTPGVAPGVSTQVIHTIRPQLGRVGTAILAILILQACLTLLVVWRLDGSGGTRDSRGETGQAASDERPEEQQQALAALEEKLRREFEFRRREERLEAERSLFNQLLGHVKVAPDGKMDVRELLDENRLRQKEIERLTEANFLLSELKEHYKILKLQRDESASRVDKLEETKTELLSRNDQLRDRLRQMIESRDEALAQVETAQAEIERLKSPPDEAAEESPAGEEDPDGKESAWTIPMILAVTLAVVAAIVLVAVIVMAVIKRRRHLNHPEKYDAPQGEEL